MINANRNLGAYESMGVPVWPDALPDYAGPLAGFLTGLERCETPYLVTVPCDTPLFPQDLVARLARRLDARGRRDRDGRDAREDGQLRTQPVFCLMKRDAAGKPGALHARRPAQDRRLDGAAPHASHVAFDATTTPRVRQRQHAGRAAAAWSELHEDAFAARDRGALQGYDPQALPVAQAQRVPRRAWSSRSRDGRDAWRSLDALGRVLARRHRLADRRAAARQLGDGRLRVARRASSRPSARRALEDRRHRLRRPALRRARSARGQCVRIMTGAVMPAGLDTVVPQEFVTRRRRRASTCRPACVRTRRQPAPRRAKT